MEGAGDATLAPTWGHNLELVDHNATSEIFALARLYLYGKSWELNFVKLETILRQFT